MSIWNGTMGIRFFYIPHEIEADKAGAEACLRGRAMPDLAAVTTPVYGWSGPDGLLDRDLSDGHIAPFGVVMVNLVHAEKRVSERSLAALVEQECADWMRTSGCEVVPRSIRAEIKDHRRKRLLQDVLPDLDGTGVWIDLRGRTVIAETTTDAKIDRMSPAFKEAFGVYPVCLTPESAAYTLAGIHASDIEPCAYSPEAERPVNIDLGSEFLTWLFWRYDATGGEFRVTLHGPQYGYMLEGPLTFYAEGQGAHEVTIRKGSVLNSREAASCLRAGKLLSKAKFVIVQHDNMWTGTVDNTFAFTALKLPPGDGGLRYELHAQRHLMLTGFLEAWTGLYSQFLALRSAPEKWAAQALQMEQWIIAKSGGLDK